MARHVRVSHFHLCCACKIPWINLKENWLRPFEKHYSYKYLYIKNPNKIYYKKTNFCVEFFVLVLSWSSFTHYPPLHPYISISHGLNCKLGRIIWLKNIIQKYSVFVLLFSTRIMSKHARLFVWYKKQISFLKSNTVE